MSTRTRTEAEAFRALHDRPERADPLVIPNVWDVVSARAFADAGHRALATSSAAVTAVLGYQDGGDIPADEMFDALTRIVRAVGVPVTVDIEDGYGLPPGEIVDRLLTMGAVGCNLEDTDHRSGTLKDAHRHADWLAEVTVAAGDRLVVNARVDTFLHGDRGVEETIRRGLLYTEAGADVVYPILAPVHLLPDLAEAVRTPLNALFRPDGPDFAELGWLGVSRVTFGAGLYDRATAALADIARDPAAGG
ncbi:isocitrate lyase/phosphoenolpyruvate mutase family protein [Streptomyces sp. ALI-76-A]|jgi:2-methylisocitrate lyase-like PEP mutase family enzyme|uniref:isocitrate lyase/PEP mutase family protein n=1 Tax=Streptomyces sp. ALI-76-A TaxID=3025736 RepID=UPI00256F2599|nr:isocitrate lyase/phosphoenolpyruvate mutase family protein [Streptomyces sp. ALI-76-A]MDL5206205.1 isocitrate lyase/phosphoenolpyruvate mutase family protein [Streptomyces sp. ALI-76-A]